MKKTLIFSMAAVMLCMCVNAATVAYWRFEDGTNGVVNGTYLDTSGNASTMAVIGATGTSDVPWPTVPQTGQGNLLAATYVDTAYNAGDYLTTDGSKWIDTYDFMSGWTIEAVVKFNGTNFLAVSHARPGIVCKEGNISSYPYFNLQLDEDMTIKVVTSRDGGDNRFISGTTVIELGEWYALAVTYDRLNSGSDREAELYLKKIGDLAYNKEGDTGGPWSNVNLNGDTPWTIGRGFRDGGGKGYVDGNIDEVRISDVVLTNTAFLGSIPEPSLVIGGIALALLAFRRK